MLIWKLELLVIVNQPYGGEFVPGLVHTARHTMPKPSTKRKEGRGGRKEEGGLGVVGGWGGGGWGEVSYISTKLRDGSCLLFLDGEDQFMSLISLGQNKLRSPFFMPPCPSHVATWWCKKEREGWAFNHFWHSGPLLAQ